MIEKDALVERAFADFPTERYSDEVVCAIRDVHKRLGSEFAPCGIDGGGRLIVADDDATVRAEDLLTAQPERRNTLRRSSWRLNTDSEIIGKGYPPEYMLGRDTNDWVWVHPQWRYLTADDQESDR